MAVVPGFVMAAGFVPFAVVAVLSVIISTVYILYFRSVNSNERSRDELYKNWSSRKTDSQ